MKTVNSAILCPSFFAIYLTTIFLFVCFSINVMAYEPEINKAPVTVKSEVDKNSVPIGNKIKYTIKVETRKDFEIQFPSFGENLAGFAIKDFGSSKSGFWGSKILTQWYILDTYKTGKYTIPAVTIKYRKKGENEWQKIVSNKVTITVQSLLDETTEAAEIRDIKGPLSFADFTYSYIILAGILVILIIAIAVIYVRKIKRSKEIIVPSSPPHVIAFEALKELMNKDLLRTGQIHEYYFELSNIVRHYMENRFQLKAPEMTTEEFLSKLKNTEELHAEHKSLLREFLSHCDMVKFAKYAPGEEEIKSSYEAASRLVEQTKETVDAYEVNERP